MKAIKIDSSGSVLIQAGDLKVWVDVWENKEGEVCADWNKYIFFEDDPEDMKIKEFQEDNWSFDLATSEAISYYELKTKNNEEFK